MTNCLAILVGSVYASRDLLSVRSLAFAKAVVHETVAQTNGLFGFCENHLSWQPLFGGNERGAL